MSISMSISSKPAAAGASARLLRLREGAIFNQANKWMISAWRMSAFPSRCTICVALLRRLCGVILAKLAPLCFRLRLGLAGFFGNDSTSPARLTRLHSLAEGLAPPELTCELPGAASLLSLLRFATLKMFGGAHKRAARSSSPKRPAGLRRAYMGEATAVGEAPELAEAAEAAKAANSAHSTTD